ncbi:MAG: hypothetical protein ACI87W_003055, partial [Halieaceae bacterium]
GPPDRLPLASRFDVILIRTANPKLLYRFF